jgi:chromosome segregation ATPase
MKDNRSYQQPTYSSLSKTSKHVTNVLKSIEKEERKRQVMKDMGDIKNSLKTLQTDANQQLKLELESQQTFEFLAEQLRVVRSAVLQLSDVFEEEFTLARYTHQADYNQHSTEINKLEVKVRELQADNQVLRKELADYRAFNDERFIHLDQFSRDGTDSANDSISKLEARIEQKFDSKVRKLVEAFKQQHEVIQSIQSDVTSHDRDITSVQNTLQQEHDRLENEIIEMKQLQSMTTKDIDTRIFLIQESIKNTSKTLSSDITNISQEIQQSKNQSNAEHAKLKTKLSQIEQELIKIQTMNENNVTAVEGVAFHLKKLQVYSESLRDRYDFLMKEVRSENQTTIGSIQEVTTKIQALKQYSDRIATEITELEKNVNKKMSGLSNAINVLVEMMDTLKQQEYNHLNGGHHLLNDSNLHLYHQQQ